jgi:hypothetical protein
VKKVWVGGSGKSGDVDQRPQNAQVCDRYNIVSENDLREAVVKTAAYVDSIPMSSPVVQMPTPTSGSV